MPETSKALFYNSENGDRVYDADSFEHLLKRFFTSGVFAGDCQVTADGNGMTCQVAAGYANTDGKVRLFDSAANLTLANAHATYDRIDTIVVERNDIDREITVKAVTGAYSAVPVATAPVRSGGIYQLVLAEVYITAGTVRVTQSMITDKRPDTSVCGYVMCAVDTPDFSELYAQFQSQAEEVIEDKTDRFDTWYETNTAAFAAWFEEIRDQLDDDAAGHLQNEIDDLSESTELAVAALEDSIANQVITLTAAIPIPGNGSSTTIQLEGITADHELIRWNFSSSAENAPPVNLTWTTANGSFTITNTGGSTSESMRPVFALPTAIAVS